ncbi:hypothetical protein GA0070616_3562 [Micromonospora nigra]|uniref:Uncharacterized protein n=1 Tax=Micromonospora nigra TaxID=145857 RepID=A0A1C6SEA5_9ACTN|nr:hypothetical protein [Micromonospora nigra]SCL27757.1 hypothetical protein GA0070616_3562 [Micromonospora nigra]
MSEQVAPPPTSDAPQAPPAVQAPPPAEPEHRSGGKKKAFGIIGAVVVFLVVLGLKFGLGSVLGNVFNADETADAKAGDCIAELPEVTGTAQEEVDSAKVVACTDTDAAYNVVGRVDGQTEAQARSGEACNTFFKEGDEGYVFYSIKPGSTGYLLCLTKKV